LPVLAFEFDNLLFGGCVSHVNLLGSVIVRQAHKSGAAGKAGPRLLTDWNAVAGGMFLGGFDCLART
jgi:hypothetical protein